MTAKLEQVLRNAFGGMEQGPMPLKSALVFYAKQSSGRADHSEATLATRVGIGPNDTVRRAFNDQLKQWDWEGAPAWAGGTFPNTSERRGRIYELLRIGQPLRAALDKCVPPYQGLGNVIVSTARSDDEDWYTLDLQQSRNFYWKRLKKFLKEVRGIGDSINSLESATTSIVERLEDPTAAKPKAVRGLIVGYVQSGKTTNFTGVIAKAIDAGYRLIIVLSGTTNLLRNQTQRRIDMDLVGVENILRGANEDEVQHDYKTDSDWPKRFISYGCRPSLRGNVDIIRLTGQQDFQAPDAGLNPLEFEFEKKDKLRPLFDRENLDHAGARIVIVKKQKQRLSNLLEELTAVGRERCAEIPTLVIDDESDQASVNTVNPRAVSDKTRKPINDCIVRMLEKLPRAQYLGYTATPFANVFIDPDDAKDLYPRDFIVSLDRPDDYMGAREFVDLAPPPPGRLSNEKALVRSVPRLDGDPRKSTDEDRWIEAIDAFVLTGALKKYRAQVGSYQFKHHTMLVHQSPRKAHHADTVKRLTKLWRKAEYDCPGSSMDRLKVLLEDCRRVWKDRGEAEGLPFPKSFNELKPALGAALTEIRRAEPVIMVNSAEGAQVPDFDAKEGVWKIIVGGAKLSRGYTIEGLTISYFRRAAKLQDTLMQMGRWCGYRRGYHDLVRLYIGRSEPDGKTKTFDLYKAFEVMSRDEEDFRAQLAMYAKGSGITPKIVPALVFNSHPQLKPTARGRMFNAEITWAGFVYREPTSQAVDVTGANRNLKAFDKLLRSRKSSRSAVSVAMEDSKKREFTVKWWVAPNRDVVSLLGRIAWDKCGSGIDAELAYLKKDSAPVDSWIVVAPELGSQAKGGHVTIGGEELSCILRARFETRFGVFTSPEHVKFAKWLVGETKDVRCRDLKPRERTGVLLVYPTRIKTAATKEKAGTPAMGFALVLPETPDYRRIAFRVQSKANPDAVVVDRNR